MALKMHGTDQVLKNLNKQISRIQGANEQGLLQAALLIKRESQDKTPVDTGNLKNSAYTDSEGGESPIAVVGYQASYAPYVHENMEMKLAGVKRADGKGYYWESGEPKFLEKAMNENQTRIIEIVKQRAKV